MIATECVRYVEMTHPYAEVLVVFLTAEQGGRREPICLSNDVPVGYRPHLRVQHGNGECLGVEFVDGPDDLVVPGNCIYATARFMYEPEVCYDELVVGARFDVLEGGRIVATGHVTRR